MSSIFNLGKMAKMRGNRVFSVITEPESVIYYLNRGKKWYCALIIKWSKIEKITEYRIFSNIIL